MYADPYHEQSIGHVTDLENGSGFADGQRHIGYCDHVLSSVALRDTTNAHVSVTNGLNLKIIELI